MSNRFETFVSLIMEINRLFQRIKDAEMSRFGLKASHTMCLYYLAQHEEGLTATRLTELCIIDKAAISRTLKQLIDKDLIYLDNPENKRSYRSLYHLTEKGKELAASFSAIVGDVMDKISLDISETDRELLYSSLEQIRDKMHLYFEDMKE